MADVAKTVAQVEVMGIIFQLSFLHRGQECSEGGVDEFLAALRGVSLLQEFL